MNGKNMMQIQILGLDIRDMKKDWNLLQLKMQSTDVLYETTIKIRKSFLTL